MGDRLWTGKPSRYVTSQLGRFSLLPSIAMLVNKCLRGLAPPYLAELCQPVVHLTGCWHLRSAASGKLDVQQTATAIGRRNFAVSGPETWNSLPAQLYVCVCRHIHGHLCTTVQLFINTKCHLLAAGLNVLKAVLFINFIIIIFVYVI